ncbi:DUF538 domain containing protein [Musa troglodytarum]|uniref:DUF538 domain containing protein n=1 Tax=Musa troglodytarum TaxID=320322 RepID=A0A9E7EFE1_9LILI|nr:DUF538 domain containing protein [Musa troglodytarum]
MHELRLLLLPLALSIPKTKVRERQAATYLSINTSTSSPSLYHHQHQSSTYSPSIHPYLSSSALISCSYRGSADHRELQGGSRGLSWRSRPLQEEIRPATGELGLPNELLPLEDIEEFGYNREAGFTWVIQKKKEHMFKKIKQHISYATVVSAFAEEHKMKKINVIADKILSIV